MISPHVDWPESSSSPGTAWQWRRVRFTPKSPVPKSTDGEVTMKTNNSMPPIPADAVVDLHLHTFYSDGLWSPTELFDHLASRNFRVVAVVDHDTTAHVAELQQLGETRGLRVLAGVEVTSEWNGTIAHVLCYASEFSGNSLPELADETRRRQLENTREVYTRLETRGYRFPRRKEILAEQRGEL